MLDSSPMAISPAAPPPNKLKRSASTASLPTPPRTQHRKRRNGKMTQVSRPLSSEESASEESANDDSRTRVHKKRRVSRVQEAEEEDAFWLGGGPSSQMDSAGTTMSTVSKLRSSSADSEEDTDLPMPLLFRTRQQSRNAGGSLASPPPSQRKTTTTRATRSTTAALSKSRPFSLRRDSSNNPFLDSPSSENDPHEATDEIVQPLAKPFEEKSTVTYVFRGQRRVLPNPLWDHANNKPLPVNPKSQLPPEHEDFVPDMRCPPKILFPVSRKTRSAKQKKPTPASQLSTPNASENESESDWALTSIKRTRRSPRTAKASCPPIDSAHLRAPGPRPKLVAEDSW